MVETRRCLGSRAFFTYERLVGCDELRSRRHAEFERQCPARALERTEPFDAAAGSLIRHEQERPSSLAHGMRRDERLDIADHVGRRQLVERRLPACLDRRQPQFFELRTPAVGRRPMAEFLERCITRPLQRRIPAHGPTAGCCCSLAHGSFETLDVGLQAIAEPVAVTDRLDRGAAELCAHA